MLSLVHDAKSKETAQAKLERNVKVALKSEGTRTLGFQSGNTDQTVYSAGRGKLWASFAGPWSGSSSLRYWNAFGIYEPTRSQQTIVVEINIPIKGNSRHVGGFFAEDISSGEFFLMHSGKVGGGRLGIGKSSFLDWSKAALIHVAEPDREPRSGVVIGKLSDPGLAENIWKFVQNVRAFKDDAVAGRQV